MSEVIAAPAPAAPAPAAPAAPDTSIPAASGPEPVQNTAESAPAAPEGGAQTPETPEQAQKRESRRVGRKLEKAYRRAAEATARADFAERQLAESRQQAAPKDDGAPTLERFDYDPEKYAQAKAKYEADRALNEHRAKQQSETQRQHDARISSEWEEKVERASDKYDDYTEVVGELAPTNPLTRAIIRASNGEDIAYHLGRNLKEAQRIASMDDPVLQILAIGQLSATLAAQPAKPKQPSQAPAPITPVSGAVTASGAPDPKKDFGAWMKWRQKQEGKAA